jgi:transglutaminase-like putative cysteine protease
VEHDPGVAPRGDMRFEHEGREPHAVFHSGIDLVQRTVSCRLVATATTPTEVVLGVAVAAGADSVETLTVTLDGVGLGVREVVAEHGTRLHVVSDVGPGTLSVMYDAVVGGPVPILPVTELDRLRYLRPSRYCESDRLAAFARFEFRDLAGTELVAAVSSWVGMRVAYVAGASRPTDGAVSTLLAREGVCRDFAHLVIAMLRACDVPARLVAVYAPGLEPMDFHAVAEACVDDEWIVVDPTCLAPRSTLLRIATGRDAADTAFLSANGDSLVLESLIVGAVTNEALPTDDVTEAVRLS